VLSLSSYREQSLHANLFSLNHVQVIDRVSYSVLMADFISSPNLCLFRAYYFIHGLFVWAPIRVPSVALAFYRTLESI
jgi:hypothetical protein